MPKDPEAAESGPCTRCGAPRDTSGYPLWCLSCRAKHKREYEATKRQMQETRGYSAGVSAMRDYLVGRFKGYGTQSSFTGIEIAHLIHQCRGPFDPVKQPEAIAS